MNNAVQIVVQQPTTCPACKEQMTRGDWAWWVRVSVPVENQYPAPGLYHEECLKAMARKAKRAYSTAAEPTVRRLVSHYPMVAGTRQRALDFLLFHFGTGYYWVGGRLVMAIEPDEVGNYRHTQRERAKKAKERKAEQYRCAAAARKYLASLPPEAQEETRRQYKRIRDENYRRRQQVGRRIRWEVPTGHSLILNVPEDVDPGWKALCVEACEMFLAVQYRFVEQTWGSIEEGRKAIQEVLTKLKGA